MKFNRSSIDEQLWQEYHNPAYADKQKWVKGLLQEAYLKALDELTITIEENARRISHIQDILNDNISEEEKLHYRNGILKYENLSVLTKKVCEIYLIMLDVNTYGTYGIIAEDEWEWRTFARHFYTVLYEHSNSVNRSINEILKIVKSSIEEGYNLTSLIEAKKEYSAFITDNSGFAKQIRVNVDAHFDGDYIEHLELITELSYSGFVGLFHTYNNKMQSFLHELKPALDNIRISADFLYNRFPIR